MGKKVLLLTLQTFSTTGGIQKMTRTLAHALTRVALNTGGSFSLSSLYDADTDIIPQYLPAENFKGFGNNRITFLIKALAAKPDVLIISHINLAFIGLAVKAIDPKCKVWLIAHGIEVWRPLSYLQKLFLKNCDKVLCVSNFTKQEVITRHAINAAKCVVLNNVVDPFATQPATFDKPPYLLNRYDLNTDTRVLFTLTRLSSAEQYKGYEQVIKIISRITPKFPNLKYILSGSYDPLEEIRVKNLISQYKVEKQVILTGFINDDELTDHFLLADVFILPSKKEGFGLVYLEALCCGLPVICGNADGSLDAIKNGELGTAVNPDDLNELENAVTGYLEKPLTADTRKNLQQQCLLYFNEPNYIKDLQQLLINE